MMVAENEVILAVFGRGTSHDKHPGCDVCYY